jgi:hypothetical protein
VGDQDAGPRDDEQDDVVEPLVQADMTVKEDLHRSLLAEQVDLPTVARRR